MSVTSNALPANVGQRKTVLDYAPTIYVSRHVNIANIPKCLEDRRAKVVAINAPFDAERLLQQQHARFLLFDKGYFELYNRHYQPIKFSYRSRNAVMSWMWRNQLFRNWTSTKFVDVDGLWQLPQPPVLYFVFGRDAATLQSSYLIDDNTVYESYEADMPTDMARLAAIAKSNTECNPHFFVVNRGQEYWAVNITDPAVSFAFGPSTKTRVISQLVNGSATIQTLIDEGQPLAEAESRSSQSPGFKLRDGNGEEVVEGEPFALQVLTRNDGDEYDSEDDNWPCVMFDGKDWISTSKDFIMPDEIPTLYSTVDHGHIFGLAIVDGIAHITCDGMFLHSGSYESNYGILIQPFPPPEHRRIQISYDTNNDIMLSAWPTGHKAICEWIKFAYGHISLRDAHKNVSDKQSMRLRVVKI